MSRYYIRYEPSSGIREDNKECDIRRRRRRVDIRTTMSMPIDDARGGRSGGGSGRHGLY
jgi:hypothetical protein